MVSLAIEVIVFPAIYFLRRDEDRPAKQATASVSMLSGIVHTVRQSAVDTLRLFGRLIGQSAFARIIVFFLLI